MLQVNVKQKRRILKRLHDRMLFKSISIECCVVIYSITLLCTVPRRQTKNTCPTETVFNGNNTIGQCSLRTIWDKYNSELRLLVESS